MQTTPLARPKSVHFLCDPDKWEPHLLQAMLRDRPTCLASIIVGGTYVHSNNFTPVMQVCTETGLPVGNILTAGALDAMLSRKADFVILPILLGSASTRFITDHVIQASSTIMAFKLRSISTGYLMFDGGATTSMQFFTQMHPIPRDKVEIVETLSLTAAQLNLQMLYLEAGSGATYCIKATEVAAARKHFSSTILVGGGIHSVESCRSLFEAGATGIVLGTIVEQRKDISWLKNLS